MCSRVPWTMAWPSETDPQVCAIDPLGSPPAERTQCGVISIDCATDGVLAPQLACLATPLEPPATPETVTLTGYVDVFSSGPSSDGARIQVFRASSVGGTR